MPDDAADSLTRGLAARLGFSSRQDLEPDDLEIWRAAEAKRYAKFAARRSPDIADFSFQETTRKEARQAAERRIKTDSALIVELLSGLLRGELIGLLENENFADVRAGFAAALSELGRTVAAPNLPANSVNKSDLRTEMLARSLGVTPMNARKIAPHKPRLIRRFDSFMASMPAEPATLQAAIAAGSTDGLPAGFTDLLAALVGAVRGAALANDAAALQQIGEDFGSLSAALMTITNSASDASTAQRSSGYLTVKKGQHLIEVAPNCWADFQDVERDAFGKPRLKRGCGTPELRKRIAAAQKA